MKQRNMIITFKDSSKPDLYLGGDITVAMDPLGFYVVRNNGRMFGFNSEEIATYEYEFEDESLPENLGDNVHKLQ